MNRVFSYLFTFCILTGSALMSAQDQQGLFVPNEGQWEGGFEYKMLLKQGAIFFESEGLTALLHQHSHDGEHANHPHGLMEPGDALVLKMNWEGANSVNSSIQGRAPAGHYHNYIRGNDPNKWFSYVPVYTKLVYEELYSGVDVSYYGEGDALKYDILLHPGAKVQQVAMRYQGQENLRIQNGHLVLEHSLGNITEYIPESYQIIDGQKIQVNCAYKLVDGLVKFKLGKYDRSHELIIDPLLIFSSYIGGPGTSWGFTATYGLQGEFYGGAVAFDQSYPTTPGAFSDSLDALVDMAISKFTADGGSLIYSTYIGGKRHDIPHSIVTNHRDELFIVGNTGSDNFPMAANAFRDTFTSGQAYTLPYSGFNFPTGSNLIIARLSSDGSQLLASTYLGGSVSEGLNIFVNRNYGDYARSEIVMLGNDKVAISSSSLSPDLPFSRVGTSANDSSQNAIVMAFDENLGNLLWGNYFGGTLNETGYSIRANGSEVFLTGATNSLDMPTHSGAVQDTLGGQYDGYIAKFDAGNGSFLGATYMGNASREQSFIIDIDRLGDVYAYGQCGQSFDISPDVYAVPGSRQFVRKYGPDLDTLLWATQVGSGFNKSDLIPTSFMIDRCLNIYLSGWNGHSNIPATSFMNANTTNLPVTADAFQDSTDGSDFYFMILNRNADSLLFGSYFGGSSHEHVDGGTSRFSPEGVVYQAACAGCRSRTGFPTTPNSFSPTKPSSECNYGAIKFDFQITVRSIPSIDFNVDVDTICDKLEVKMTNESLNANQFFWDFGNGQFSNLAEPIVVYDSLGVYTITLIARDTLCDISDTSSIVIIHDQGEKPRARFTPVYAGCDKNFRVELMNESSDANSYLWDFGDGVTSATQNPTHDYGDTGTYTITLVAIDNICQKSDTTSYDISFRDSVPEPRLFLDYDECQDGKLDVFVANDRKRYQYEWYVNGLLQDVGRNPNLKVDQAGLVEVRAEISDSICHNIFDVEESYLIERLGLPTFIPNVFTPNEDEINEVFFISGIACGESISLHIFNRWGMIVFQTDQPFDEFWDGTVNGKPAADGVYSYILKNGKSEERGHLTLIH